MAAEWPIFQAVIPHLTEDVKSKSVVYIGDNANDAFYFRKSLAGIGIENVISLPNIASYVSQLDVDVLFVELRSIVAKEGIEKFEAFILAFPKHLIIGLTNPLIRKKQVTLQKPNLRYMYRPIKRSGLIRLLSEVLGNAVQRQRVVNAGQKIHTVGWQVTPRVLVAEDNKINQMVIKKMLTAFGIDCLIADNGRLALETVQRLGASNIDVILMDLMMPEMDGYESSRHIRKLSGKANRPYIIGLTANAFWEDKLKAFEAGMNDFVTKPVTSEVLKAALEKAVS